MPTVLITGGTGFLGENLTSYLAARDYDVIILSRKAIEPPGSERVTYALWNVEQQQIDVNAIAKADYIVHLAGAGVMDKRWSEKYKKEIVESRTESSRLLIKGLQEIKNNVKAVVSASAIGWYGDDPEIAPAGWKGYVESDKPDSGFLGETCRLWELSIAPVTEMDKRLVTFRLGIIVGKDGGAFSEFRKPMRFGIAAILGNGKQVISWIHVEDVCRLVVYAIEKESLSGVYNAVSPEPVTNKRLMIRAADIIRKTFYVPVHVPGFALKLFLGQKSIEILKSLTVSCSKIKKAGFSFLYPTIDAALEEVIKKK